MRTILILLDSLNRHLLPAYGGDWVRTPNIDRLAERGVVFDRHYCCSMPCIPARRDIMTGRPCFLEAPWGPLQPWDSVLPELLREGNGTYSHLITDHCHYFNGGAGARYQNVFDSWEYHRGQPWDPWRGVVEPRPMPEGSRYYCYGKRYHHQHLANLEYRDRQDDQSYSSVQCVQSACEFVERNARSDNWYLQLELFDPHEPFDCPDAYLKEYGDNWSGPLLTCPDYAPLDDRDTAEVVEHLRKAYAASLTMVDRWLGHLFDRMDKLGMWRDTMVVLTTDHGFMLGEHGYWAKNYMMCYEELTHLPLIVHHPDARPGRRAALTGTIDLMPTLLKAHGLSEAPKSVVGRSIMPLLEADGEHHDGLLLGYFGREMNMVKGHYTYHRAPADGSTCDMHFTDYSGLGADLVRSAEVGTHLKWCNDLPHFRVPRPSSCSAELRSGHRIYNLQSDPHQRDPLNDDALERHLAAAMRDLLEQADAPSCQLQRLGLNAMGD